MGGNTSSVAVKQQQRDSSHEARLKELRNKIELLNASLAVTKSETEKKTYQTLIDALKRNMKQIEDVYLLQQVNEVMESPADLTHKVATELHAIKQKLPVMQSPQPPIPEETPLQQVTGSESEVHKRIVSDNKLL